ncbi:MAG: glycosyltransferase family 39 protein [Candidatus Daviesbacteria bacterium]
MALSKKKTLIILGLILTLFLVTRVYKISEIPVSMYWDEASIGYNAYSVSLTGKDEWGSFLPLHFRAFGEFKLPVYIYSVTIFEKLFGINTFSVRLPATLFSLMTTILVFLLVVKIANRRDIALFGSFFFVISPWGFIISRTGFEATAGLMFYLLGIYLFLLIDKNKFLLLLSALSFIFSIYSYNSFRIVTPVTILTLLILLGIQSKKNILELIWIGVISLIIFILSVIPIVRLAYFEQGLVRFQTIGISFNDQNKSKVLGQLIGNYLIHFSPQFLFLQGESNLRNQQKGFGQLYWIDLPLLLLGLFYIFQKRESRYILPLILLIIGIIPAAITKEVPHALRSISSVPFFIIISAFGIEFLIKMIKKPSILYICLIPIFLVSFCLYFYNFIVFYPVQSSSDWQYGYKQIFINYKKDFKIFDHVIISDRYAQPYIFALWYLRYNPEKFKSEVSYNPFNKWGFSNVNSFSNFIFAPIEKDKIPEGNSLIFTSPSERLNNVKENGLIRNLDSSVAFYVYEYQK